TPHIGVALILLPAIAVTGHRTLAKHRDEYTTWALIGSFGCLPPIAAYIKLGGADNNLRATEVWAAMGTLPLIWSAMREPTGWSRAFPGVGLFGGLLVNLPLKVPPSARRYAYGTDFTQRLQLERRAHRRVLVAHGASVLVQAGIPDPPLDRAVSFSELG